MSALKKWALAVILNLWVWWFSATLLIYLYNR
jgi:hypothetical protein